MRSVRAARSGAYCRRGAERLALDGNALLHLDLHRFLRVRLRREESGRDDLIVRGLGLDAAEDLLDDVGVFACRNAVAFCRPWPSRSSPKLKYEPAFWTTFFSSATSRTVPSQGMPEP